MVIFNSFLYIVYQRVVFLGFRVPKNSILPADFGFLHDLIHFGLHLPQSGEQKAPDDRKLMVDSPLFGIGEY